MKKLRENVEERKGQSLRNSFWMFYRNNAPAYYLFVSFSKKSNSSSSMTTTLTWLGLVKMFLFLFLKLKTTLKGGRANDYVCKRSIMFTDRRRYGNRSQEYTHFVFIKNIFKSEKEDGSGVLLHKKIFLKVIICVYHNIASNRFYLKIQVFFLITPRVSSSSSSKIGNLLENRYASATIRRRIDHDFPPWWSYAKQKNKLKKKQKRQKRCARRVAADTGLFEIDSSLETRERPSSFLPYQLSYTVPVDGFRRRRIPMQFIRNFNDVLNVWCARHHT